MDNQMQPQKKTNIFCILGLIFTFCLQPLGLIFSIIGMVQTKKSGEGGRGLAIAGLVISIVQVVIIIAAFAMGFAIWPELKDEIKNSTACTQATECGPVKNGYRTCRTYTSENSYYEVSCPVD